MAKYVCTTTCQFLGRIYTPESALKKDRIYSGGETPPEAYFRPYVTGEEEVVHNSDEAPTTNAGLQQFNEHIDKDLAAGVTAAAAPESIASDPVVAAPVEKLAGEAPPPLLA